MAQVTVTVQGSVEEVQEALQKLGASLGQRLEEQEEAAQQERVVADKAPRQEEDVKAATESTWTRREARRLWRELSEEARRVMQELARRLEGYAQADLAEALELSPRQIGARLSSVGHAMRKLPGKVHPVVRERSDGALVYRLAPEVARAAQSRRT